MLFVAVIVLLAARGESEDGMCLVTCNTSFGGDYMAGTIRRIDMRAGQVVNTTGSLGYGVFPRFAPDGQQFAFINGSTVTIATIDGAVVRTFPVAGNGNLSWTRTGIWICTNNRFYKYDINGNLVLQKSFQYCERGFVSQNEVTGGGTWTQEWCPVVYSMGRGTSLKVPRRDASQAVAGCSVCPNPSGTMITNNMNNPAHRAMRIVDTLAQEKYYLLLSNITGLGTGFYWLEQCWSGNSDEWIVLPIGRATDVSNPQLDISREPWIYNIVTREVHQLANRTSDFWQPFDYYSGFCPGSATPALQLSPSSVAFSADSGSANPPSQNVAATTPTGTISGLAVSGANSWLTVSPSGASGAAITIVNSPRIAGLRPGTYGDTITVTTSNAGSKTFTVTLTVRRPASSAVLTSLTVSPPLYTAPAGGRIGFIATCRDQNAGYFTGTKTIGWTVSGGGAIDTNGVFTAAATPSHGPHIVTATVSAGTVTLRDTAYLMVSRKSSVHKRIDSGTDSYLPAGWEADNAYVTGGSDWNNTASVSVTGVCGAAPASVYASFRRGSPHSYRVPSLPQDFYTVRMHLADPSVIARQMSYSILGVNVLREFDIASLAGGANKALVVDFPAQVQDANGLGIACSGSNGSEVFEAGFEVIRNQLIPITIMSPLGGEHFVVGQTIPIRFFTDTTQVAQLYVDLSVNAGRNWYPLANMQDGIMMINDRAGWGTYNWTIADSVGEDTSRVSTVSSNCRIRLKAYFSTGGDATSDSSFAIAGGSASGRDVHAVASRKTSVSILGSRLRVVSVGAYRIEIFSVAGAALFLGEGFGPQAFALGGLTKNVTLLIRIFEGGRVSSVMCVFYGDGAQIVR